MNTIMTSIADLPHVDPQTAQFAVDFCKAKLGAYELKKVVLFGSRVDRRKTPRSNSDHDVMAVVADTAPDDIRTGGSLHRQIFDALETARKERKLGEIDLMVCRESRFMDAESGTFPFDARMFGREVFAG